MFTELKRGNTAKQTVFKTVLMLILVLIAGCDRHKETATHGFLMADGIQVGDLSGIEEAYSVENSKKGYDEFTVNVSAEHIAPYFERLISMVVRMTGF